MKIEELLAPRDARIRALARRLRTLVRSALPDAEERVNGGWGGICYHDAQAGYLCGIFPREQEVRLLFEHGAALPDPDALFTGGGKQTRYVAFTPGDAIPDAAVRAMLSRAVLHSAPRRARGRRVRRDGR